MFVLVVPMLSLSMFLKFDFGYIERENIDTTNTQLHLGLGQALIKSREDSFMCNFKFDFGYIESDNIDTPNT